MDMTHYFENLGVKLDEGIATVRAAAEEDRQQLRQRIDKAEEDASLALKDAEQHVGKASAEARSKWAQMKADASTKTAEAKAKMNQHGKEIDATLAENDAELAEADATAAIDFAGWAIDNARLASLHPTPAVRPPFLVGRPPRPVSTPTRSARPPARWPTHSSVAVRLSATGLNPARPHTQRHLRHLVDVDLDEMAARTVARVARSGCSKSPSRAPHRAYAHPCRSRGQNWRHPIPAVAHRRLPMSEELPAGRVKTRFTVAERGPQSDPVRSAKFNAAEDTSGSSTNRHSGTA